MAGLYFEEFTPGQVFEHAWTRTVTEMDNMLFSMLTMNPQPLHIDAHFAAGTEFGRPLVNSLFTLGLMIGMSVNDELGRRSPTSACRVQPNPYSGRYREVRTEVVSKRESKSRPNAGIVEFRHRAINQDGVEVASCLRTAFMRRRPG
jgi:acyl dehydratase